MNKLRVRFSAGKVEEKIFKYIGFGIQQLPSKIILDRSEYTDNIKNVTIDPKRASEKNKPLNESWLVGCFGFNGPLRQYFSLYRAVSQREGERGEKG